MITIFTPTFNRAYTLPRLYESLCQQSNKNFEWLIIDDGSTDNTESLVKTFNCQDFTIRFYKQRNGGKHRAINKGVGLANGYWFFIVDSDDYLVKDAIEISYHYLNQIAKDDRFCGVVLNKAYNAEQVVGTECIHYQLDTDFLSYRTKYKVKGDRAEIIKTTIMKNFPFPEFYNEKFCPESLVWNRIAQKYIARYINKNIYICKYLADGLSTNISSIRAKSPIGCSLSEFERFYYAKSFKYKFISLGEFWAVYKYVPHGCPIVKATLLLKVLWPFSKLYILLLKFRQLFV